MTHVGSREAVARFRGTAGVARRDITPPVGILARNWGPAAWDAAESVHRPFTLTVIVLRGEAGDLVVLIGADGTWWRRVDDERDVRGRILDGLGLDTGQLTLSLSHTHAGPILCTGEQHRDGGAMIPAYLDAIVDAAIAAGREALDAAVPAVLEFAVGSCTLAAERELDLDGVPVVGFNPAAPADDTVLVARVAATDGTLLGTIVNYACHPTTLAWQSRAVSPDYVGAMRALVEGDTGAPVLFLQGASGELAPREQYTGDVRVADRHGRALGHAVLGALATLPPVGQDLVLTGVVESGAPLAMWEAVPGIGSDRLVPTSGPVRLDFADLPTLDDLEEEWADIDPRSRAERLSRARNLRDGYVMGPDVDHPLWVIRIGDGVLLAHPGEAYSRLQVRVRAAFPTRPILVANLTNGPGFVYLPTDEAYEREAYQAWQTPLAKGSLARLEEAAIARIAALFDEEDA